MFAVELLMLNNSAAAKQILDSVSDKQSEYLMQGEVKMDLALMQQLAQ